MVAAVGASAEGVGRANWLQRRVDEGWPSALCGLTPSAPLPAQGGAAPGGETASRRAMAMAEEALRIAQVRRAAGRPQRGLQRGWANVARPPLPQRHHRHLLLPQETAKVAANLAATGVCSQFRFPTEEEKSGGSRRRGRAPGGPRGQAPRIDTSTCTPPLSLLLYGSPSWSHSRLFHFVLFFYVCSGYSFFVRFKVCSGYSNRSHAVEAAPTVTL